MAKVSKETPKTILNKPKLSYYPQFILDTYFFLSCSRTFTSVGPSFIPYSEIICWLNENRVADIYEREDIIFFICTLDAEYIRYVDSKHPKDAS